MKYTISDETFVRLSKAASRPHDQRPFLDCVRLEYRDGKFFAIASNSIVMVVELIGETDQPNGFVDISISAIENYNVVWRDLVFEHFPEFNLLMLDGMPVKMNDTSPAALFQRWFEVFPSKSAKKSHGFMFIDADAWQSMIDASPSGQICFPEIIDTTRAVIVRDNNDPNWCGVFIPNDKTKTAKPAIRPEWLP